MPSKFDSQISSYLKQVRLLGHFDFVDVGRETVNLTALDAKKRTIPKFAEDKFTVRRKSFFKAMTKVNFAKRSSSNTLDSVYSEVGFLKRKSTENMEKQEFGGEVVRPIKPTNQSRVGKSYNKAVSKRNMFNMTPKGMVRQSLVRGKNKRQRMAVAIKMAERKGNEFFIADEFKAIYKRSGSGWKRMFIFEGYQNKQTIKARHLMRDSADEAMRDLPKRFVEAAQDKIEFRAKKVKW